MSHVNGFSMSTRFALVFVVSALAGRAITQEAPPRFAVETAAQTHAGCMLLSMAESGALHLKVGDADKKLDQLVELRQDGRLLPPMLTRNFVSLSNGDRLPLDADAAASLQDGRLRVWPAKELGDLHDKGLSLFGPNVVLLFWSVPDGVDDAERFFAELQEESRKRDVAYLKNGDRIEGTLSALGGKTGCVFTSDGRKVQTPWAQLAGIAFNTDRQARLRTKGRFARAILDGGARVNLLDLRFDDKSRRWAGKTQFGAAIDLPEVCLLALDVRQAAAVDLSEMTPARYEHRPYLGPAWPLAKDAAATGRPLRLAGNTFEKGLGMHAASQATYKLDGKYTRFDAVVGIDEMSRRGRARVAIEVDGKRIDLNEGKELTAQTTPLPVRLDVKGVRTLTLIVEVGSFGDVQADVNWAKARLIKKE
jgi:hypothetical protein